MPSAGMSSPRQFGSGVDHGAHEAGASCYQAVLSAFQESTAPDETNKIRRPRRRFRFGKRNQFLESE
jgi:hypothetical protein